VLGIGDDSSFSFDLTCKVSTQILQIIVRKNFSFCGRRPTKIPHDIFVGTAIPAAASAGFPWVCKKNCGDIRQKYCHTDDYVLQYCHASALRREIMEFQ